MTGVTTGIIVDGELYTPVRDAGSRRGRFNCPRCGCMMRCIRAGRQRLCSPFLGMDEGRLSLRRAGRVASVCLEEETEGGL